MFRGGEKSFIGLVLIFTYLYFSKSKYLSHATDEMKSLVKTTGENKYIIGDEVDEDGIVK